MNIKIIIGFLFALTSSFSYASSGCEFVDTNINLNTGTTKAPAKKINFEFLLKVDCQEGVDYLISNISSKNIPLYRDSSRQVPLSISDISNGGRIEMMVYGEILPEGNTDGFFLEEGALLSSGLLRVESALGFRELNFNVVSNLISGCIFEVNRLPISFGRIQFATKPEVSFQIPINCSNNANASVVPYEDNFIYEGSERLEFVLIKNDGQKVSSSNPVELSAGKQNIGLKMKVEAVDQAHEKVLTHSQSFVVNYPVMITY